MKPSGGYHAVVLAAGAGSRFGGSKLTAPFEGGVLLDAALRTACAAPVKSVVVVTGAHGDAVDAAVAEFASRSELPVRSVRCADHGSGMSASLRCGLTSLPADAAGAFIFLGDMPNIPATLAQKLHAEILAGSLAAAPAVGHRLGHPVLITRPLFGLFSSAGGDSRGRATLRDLGEDLAVVEIDHEGVVTDVDVPADLL